MTDAVLTRIETPPGPIEEVPVPATAAPFTAVERAGFLAEDKQAATMVTGIMMTIFAIAIVLYTVILFVVMDG